MPHCYLLPFVALLYITYRQARGLKYLRQGCSAIGGNASSRFALDILP